jgi:hypothetical protein
MPTLTPEQFRSLNKDITSDELRSYKYERFSFLILCIVSLAVTIWLTIINVTKENISLASLGELGSAGILGVSVYSLLVFVGKTRKYVKENIELFINNKTNEGA